MVPEWYRNNIEVVPGKYLNNIIISEWYRNNTGMVPE